MYKTIILSLFMLFAYYTTAQEVQIEIEKGFELESIETKGDVGFVCVLKTNNPVSKENDFSFKFYDSEMKFVKQEEFHLGKYSYGQDVIRTEDNIHRVYVTMSGKIIIHTESRKSFEFSDVEVDLPTKRSAVGDMIVQDDIIFFIMRIGADWGVFKVNWETGESVFFPVKVDGIEKLKINGFQLVLSGELFVFVTTEVENKEFDQYALRFMKTGELIETELIAHKKLLALSVVEMNENEFLFTGTYSTGSRHRSEGLVFTLVNNREVTNEKTIAYSSIPDFNTLSGTGENKGHYVGNLEVIKTETGSMVIGEACYPINHRNHNNELIFDYYQFTHGFVCVLDEEGELTWSATFKDGFRHFSLDISESYLVVTEEDAETFILKNYKSGSTHEVNLTDKVITTVDNEEATTAKKPRIKFDPTLYEGFKMWGKDAILVYKKEKVKTDDGKKMIVTVTKISR